MNIQPCSCGRLTDTQEGLYECVVCQSLRLFRERFQAGDSHEVQVCHCGGDHIDMVLPLGTPG
jgi:hypothetical protein